MALSKIPSAGFQDNVKFRNIIINGDMSIAQRGTSASNVSTGYHTVDRFQLTRGAGTLDVSQQTDAPTGSGFVKSFKVLENGSGASPSAGDVNILLQRFEGQNLQYLLKGTSSAKSLTLSFWIKAKVTGTYIAEIYDSDNTRQISKTYTVSSSETWEKKTITYDGDTSGTLNNDNGSSLQVNLFFTAGSNFTSGTLNTSWGSRVDANRAVGQVNALASANDYVQITGIQLEAGEVASDFEFLPHDVNLLRCQRYFEKSNNLSLSPGDTNADGFYINLFVKSSSNQNYASVYFRRDKRVEPTVTFYSNSTGASGKYRNNTDSADQNATVNRSGTTAFSFRPSASTGIGAGDYYSFHWTADAEL